MERLRRVYHTGMGESPNHSELYTRHSRPGLGKLLHAFGLDLTFHRAKGDRLWYYDEQGQEVEVIDLVGSYGATLLGHNAEPLVNELKSLLDRDPPQFVQGSIRSGAAELAACLTELAKRKLGDEYLAQFFSTGADAVEAAIKHLILIRQASNRRRCESLLEEAAAILRRKPASGAIVVDATAISGFSGSSFSGSAEFLAAIEAFNHAQAHGPYRLLALENAYHGQTLGALGLTFNARYRHPFQEHLPPVDFLPADPEIFSRWLQDHRRIFARLTVDDTGMKLVPVFHSDILGLFVEPILGEGGVIPLSGSCLQALLSMARAAEVPVVADEIQTGMGRTGSLFAWEAAVDTPGSDPAPDLILLSKALGGGLAKISAVLTRQAIAEEEFTIIHASTFAEDEIGCRMALKTLDLLFELNEARLAQCRLRGGEWLDRLRPLAKDFPGVIAGIRGAGLLIGIEFQDRRDCGSNLLRFICTQGDFGYVVAGFLLHEFGIRVAPALNAKRTVRIEPSIDLGPDDMDHVARALRRLCQVLEAGDTWALTRFLLPEYRGNPAEPLQIEEAARRLPHELMQAPPHCPEKIAFLGHFIDPGFLARHEPPYARFSTEQLERLIAQTWETISPCRFATRDIRSANGTTVNFNFIGLSVTSQILVDSLRRRDLGTVRQQIREAVEVAREAGCKLVGFGQFTSIVTHNCLEVVTPTIGFTTGNSLTVGMAFRALGEALAETGKTLEKQFCAVLGAGGNIGSIFARLLADHSQGLLLVGGSGQDSKRRLEQTIGRILLDQLETMKAARPLGLIGRGLERLLPPTARQAYLEKASQDARPVAAELATRWQEAPETASLLRIGTLEEVRECGTVVTAVNAARPFIGPEHLAPDVVVCDISIPSAVQPEAGRRAGVRLFKGGVVALPHQERLNIGALPLEAGAVYACMAETILLGLERRWSDYSMGDVEKNKVLEMLKIADNHGFKLARLKREDSL